MSAENSASWQVFNTHTLVKPEHITESMNTLPSAAFNPRQLQ